MILLTGTLSPVRAASSIFKEALSNRRPSAGTESPASSSTTSPGTSSSECRITIFPSRRTLQVAAVMVCSASIAASALLSCTTPKMAFSRTTARMMITSAHSFSPDSMPVKALTPAAIIRMINMGSFSCAINFCSHVAFSASFSLLGPYCSSRLAASAELKPSGEVCKVSRTFSWDNPYSRSIACSPFHNFEEIKIPMHKATHACT